METEDKEEEKYGLGKLGKNLKHLKSFLAVKTNVHKKIHRVVNILKNDFDVFVLLDVNLESERPLKVNTKEANT